MIFGSILGLCLTPPWKVYRSDGSVAGHNPHLNDYSHESLGQKFVRIVKRECLSIAAIRHEKRVFALIPMFFAANWFYSYQQNIVNGGSFDLDGRALNSALYWMAQMLGAFIMGYVCDMPWFSRPKRALIAWSFLFIFGNVVMGGGLAFELVRERNPKNWIVFHTSEYAGGAILYFCYGFFDSLWQTVSALRAYPGLHELMKQLTYWLLGAMCSTPELAGRLVAIYKVAQSVGATVAYQLTALNVSDKSQFISNWVVTAGCLLFARK